jgi:hypothetical protein
MLVVVYYLEFVMAPRAYWKGYLKLSLVSCPIALFPATSEREKISFHQLNKKTGNRIKYHKVDAESGDEVDSADIIKGYEVGKGDYIELDPEELEAVAIESKRTIDMRDSTNPHWGRSGGAVAVAAPSRLRKPHVVVLQRERADALTGRRKDRV